MAVEKLLKTLLCELGIRYRRTHDIAELAGLVKTHDAPLPAMPIALERLSAFAVEFRYDDLPGTSTLDPVKARQTVRLLRQHIGERIGKIAVGLPRFQD